MSFDGDGNAKTARLRMGAFQERQTGGGSLVPSLHLRGRDITWVNEAEEYLEQVLGPLYVLPKES